MTFATALTQTRTVLGRCRLVQSQGVPPTLAHLTPTAVDLCCMLLRADAVALSIANGPAEASSADAGSVRWQGPFPPEVPGVADAVIGRAAADARTEWLCAPALWQVSAQRCTCICAMATALACGRNMLL